MGSKYADITAAVQVIGCILKNPLIIDDTDYFFNEDDFTSELHKVIFKASYNLFQMGAENLDSNTIEDYLEQRPKSYAIYKAANGSEWIEEAVQSANIQNFDYYYQRLKKMTLLRGYENVGLNLKWLYDPDNIENIEKKKEQEDRLDAMSLNDLADIIDNRIMDIRTVYVDNASNDSISIGSGIEELLSELKKTPEMGVPLYGSLINTICRGARLKKFYMRSASSGVGKSRSMMADACYISCSHYYDLTTESWVEIGTNEPVLFISNELELNELQTMALAFISGVNEEHILSSKCSFKEQERLAKAAEILKNSKLFIESIPDYKIQDIENCIKRNLRINKTHYVFFDYLCTTLSILEEISSKAHGTKLREDNILFMLSNRLKDLCNQYNIFIMTASQLNGDFKTDDMPDQNLLRGAKNLADKLDFGCILLDTTPKDKETLRNFCEANAIPIPNVKLSIYKNRRGSFARGYLWMNADKSTCRYNPIFATDWQYNLIPIEDFKIVIDNNKDGVEYYNEDESLEF